MEEELDDTARDEASDQATSRDEAAEAVSHFATTRERMTLLDAAATPLPAARAGLFQKATCRDKPRAPAVSPSKAAQHRFRSSEVIIFQYRQPLGDAPHVTASQIRSQQCGASQIKAEGVLAPQEQQQGLGQGAAEAGRAPACPPAAAPVPDVAPLPAGESAEPKQKVEIFFAFSSCSLHFRSRSNLSLLRVNLFLLRILFKFHIFLYITFFCFYFIYYFVLFCFIYLFMDLYIFLFLLLFAFGFVASCQFELCLIYTAVSESCVCNRIAIVAKV